MHGLVEAAAVLRFRETLPCWCCLWPIGHGSQPATAVQVHLVLRFQGCLVHSKCEPLRGAGGHLAQVIACLWQAPADVPWACTLSHKHFSLVPQCIPCCAAGISRSHRAVSSGTVPHNCCNCSGTGQGRSIPLPLDCRGCPRWPADLAAAPQSSRG